ncbi:MAG: inorganic phosphate transporter [Actinomycetaceae bacterium]|nr:inorganic phosphate transporter [Actinomycetaceae bacterium]
MILFLVIFVIITALVFDFTNGFHDAANAIATCVSTRALKPRTALIMAGVMNMVGALLGTEVAKTIGDGIIDISQFSDSPVPEDNLHGLVIIMAALIGAIAWNLITWWFGLPSSSSHALIGGLAGAGLASVTKVQWWGIIDHVIIPMFVSPFIGFIISFVVLSFILKLLQNRPYHRTMRRFRRAQIFSSAAMALGHGLQDAQKTMGVIVLALLAFQYEGLRDVGGELVIPFWVKFAAALAISLGTLAGGGRIMRTLGKKVFKVEPVHGFVAEGVSASVLYFTAYIFHAPVSTTQVVSSAIMGVGATKRLSAVSWGVAGNILIAWVLTLPAAGAFSALCYQLLHLFLQY